MRGGAARAALRVGACALLVALAVAAGAHETKPEADAGPPLLFELPEAGSYDLPPIDHVRDHALLRADGKREPVLDLREGRVAIVSFVYLHCADATGCPLLLSTLRRVDRALAAREDLKDHVRLVTVSFDPARDTPEAMAKLRGHLAPAADWRFFTASDAAELAPVLRDFGQDAVPLVTQDGEDTGLLRHVAKIFLIDHEGAVRNVYSSGLVDHRLLLRDVETLLGETPEAPASRARAQ